MAKLTLSGLLVASSLASLIIAASAQAQVLESVRVRLPTGQVITVDDGNNWYRDTRVVKYKRYYYEPRERVYVVYNDDDHHPKGHFCPPGQAKKGRC
ncbi:MAG: hypothetical protein DI628_06985 [Blastochloris viridis]|uniref:Uncharacterized protein n=1 Tax=Blastochloris viridis TaxID=1079 RepID=A0A6N4R8Z8_BLAVI|nr:MAG: hypothetical protein DI628_06985 [Blastochloris viridis]